MESQLASIFEREAVKNLFEPLQANSLRKWGQKSATTFFEAGAS
jgi:hypothetical protein